MIALLLAVCACISLGHTMDLPPCDQIARISIMCSASRFKSVCARECGGGSSGGNSNSNSIFNPPPVTASPSQQQFRQGPPTTTRLFAPFTTSRTNVQNNNGNVNQTPAPLSTSRPNVQNNNGNTNQSPGTSGQTSNNNKNCNKIDPCVGLAVANQGFRQRCTDANIRESCLDKCRYDITFDELKKAMLSKQCPMDGMRDFVKAGANQQDNRNCCEQTGVLEGKRSICFPFCNPSGNDWPGQKEALKYLPCASQMNAIMKCHWAGLTQ